MKITKEQLAKVVKDELKAIKGELHAASKMHKSQAERIEDIIKEEAQEVIENERSGHPLVHEANEALHAAHIAVDALANAVEEAYSDQAAAFYKGSPSISDVTYKIKDLYRLLEYLE